MEHIVKEILHKENIPYQKIQKATSGFTNLVYFVDDKFVIKMSQDDAIKKKLDKETLIYQNIQLSCIPAFIANGSVQDFQYLIIEKLKGKSLYSVWHKLSYDERKNCVNQIAKILRAFNKQDYKFLSDEYKDFDWANYLGNELKAKSFALAKMGVDANEINDFISNDLPNLFGQNIFGLVYNDAHFDNFIYDNDKLSLIDFDRVRVCPIDYEMLIFKTMCDNPSKFASEEDEDNIKDEDYLNIYQQFKVNYPEMFEDKNVEKRIALYQFNYLIGQAIKCKDIAWINALLKDFNK